MNNIVINNIPLPKEHKQQQRQAKLAAIADKKAKGKLTLEDIDEKLNIIIEILQDLQPPK